jgi:endonuclease/exonuclease/phosphatase family metal-dependent hydrolase
MDSVVDLQRISDLIRGVEPDLVAIQEVDSVTERTGQVEQAARLGALTGLDARFGRFMSYQGGAYGMAVLSRLPILSAENLRLPDGAEPRSALSLTVELPRTGATLTFVGIHLYRTEEERLAQAESLEAQLEGRAGPTILAGDFNSQPGSTVMDHLESGWTVIDKGEDRYTYPSFAPAREIDFVLLRPAASFQVIYTELLNEPVLSDHRPVVVDLVVGS